MIPIFEPGFGYQISIDPVISRDALLQLKDKHSTTSFEIITIMPATEVLSSFLELNERQFDSIRHDLNARIEIKVSAGKSNLGVFSGGGFLNIFDKVKGLFVSAKASVRDENEKRSTEYDLFENRFIRQADIENFTIDDADIILGEIIRVYQENRDDVQRYMQK